MTDVAIVGAGVIGCAIGLELVRGGARATVYDKNGDVGHGSTSASCGIIRRFYSTPTMTAMAHEGAHVWADWPAHLGVTDELGMAKFERPGMLFIPPVIDDDVRRIVAHMTDIGVDVELLTREDVMRTFPFFDTASHRPVRRPEADDFFESTGRHIEGAVFEKDAGYVVSPQVATHNLRVAGEKVGVTFQLGRTITRIAREDSGFALTFDDGAVEHADAVVNAAGPHSAIVNKMADVALQIETRALRRETHAVENPEFGPDYGSRGRERHIVPVCGDIDSGIYFRPEAGGRDLIVGSVDPECDTLEWVDDPDADSSQPTSPAFERQVMRLMKRFPTVGLGKLRGIMGHYDVTVLDWNPVLDRTDVPGFYVAIGTSGSSFKTSPVIGQVMAKLIDACESGHDHDRDPVKVTLPRIGYDVDLGFFSRLRAARPSSGTVLG